MFVFKSDSHRIMFHNMLKLQIKSCLLSRFGGLGQEESRVLRTRGFRQFLSLWANLIINGLPKDQASHTEYIGSQIRSISPEILELPSVKEMMDNDPALKWMIGRINGHNDCVPKPYFPSVLRNPMIQFPFKHADIQKSRALYGLLKFPFYRLSTSIYADSSESFKGLSEPRTSHTSDKEASSDPDVTQDRNAGSHSPNLSRSATLDRPDFCSNDFIYAPSELETGLRER